MKREITLQVGQQAEIAPGVSVKLIRFRSLKVHIGVKVPAGVTISRQRAANAQQTTRAEDGNDALDRREPSEPLPVRPEV